MVHRGMSQSSKARDAYEKALELDPNCAEALEGFRACSITSHADPEETRKRAMNDPEVQAILNDPAMRMILEQMQSDPQVGYFDLLVYVQIVLLRALIEIPKR